MTNLQVIQESNYQIVHEVYDLLSDPVKSSGAFIRNDSSTSSEWLLMKPSSTAPLRMLRFTQFKPIYKHGIQSVNHECIMTIKPILVSYNNSTHVYTNIPIKDGNVYSSGYENSQSIFVEGPISIPIEERVNKFTYDGSFSSLSHNINDQLDMYFKDLYTTGKFYYKDSDNHSYVSDITFRTIVSNALNSGEYKINKDSDALIALTSFNPDNVSIVNKHNGIAISFIWIPLTYNGNTVYLIFTFDILCNTHAYSVSTGRLCKALFDDAPPANTYGTGTTITWYGGTYDNVCGYDGNLNEEELAVSNNNMLISLCSSFAGNLTGKIFTGENIYQTVNIETFPSSMYFPITIRDKNNNALSYKTLSTIYEQVSVAIDYVYLTY